jgi:hypothetical protein
MQDPCQADAANSLLHRPRVRRPYQMLERSRKFRGRRVFGFDAERRLGHYSLQVVKVGVVAQSLKNSCGAAVADLGGRGEDAAQ